MKLARKNTVLITVALQAVGLFDRPTLRELDTLRWIGEGKTDKEIAATLGLSEKTVHHHVHSLLNKLNAKNRTHAVVKALRIGLIRLD